MAREPPAPPPEPRFLDADTALARIQAIVANARTIWFALIGFLAFIGLTLVSVRDIDFFSVEATTDLPIVGIAIPTDIFFWSAAWLAAILHVYFHLYLVKLWDVLAEAPRKVGGATDGRQWEMRYGVPTELPQASGTPFGDRVFPWLVVDWALRRRPDQPTTPRPMDWLSDTVTWLVVWLATPFMLLAFWLRSMPAHAAWLSLLIAFALFATLYATLCGWLRARERLRRPGLRVGEEGSPEAPLALPSSWRARMALLASILTIASLIRTQMEAEVAIGSWRWSSLAPIDLVGAEIAQRPADWRDHDVARGQFQVAWCRDQGIPLQTCQEPQFPDQHEARKRWCANNDVEEAHCEARFEDLKADFDRAWEAERAAYLANVIGPDLRGRDLRGAEASGAFLAGIDLSGARLERANLREARLERANLGGAGVRGANLYAARLEGASLEGAGLQRAHLQEARLEGANLSDGGLERADLTLVRLERAKLIAAQLQGANLRWARLDGAILTAAQLQEANLRWARLDGAQLDRAQLQFANWGGAIFSASSAHSAVLAGGRNLRQSQLAHVIGNDLTVLPRDADSGEQLYVWSCWAEPPSTLSDLLRHFQKLTHDTLRSQWLCPPGVAPERTGRPAEPESADDDVD